jgi:hypothetical protein
MPIFPGPETTVPAYAGTVFISINKKNNYFFLAAFFLPPFFFADFFALVAIVIYLHVELVRAQYIHKLKIPSKCRVRFCCATSHHHRVQRSHQR